MGRSLTSIATQPGLDLRPEGRPPCDHRRTRRHDTSSRNRQRASGRTRGKAEGSLHVRMVETKATSIPPRREEDAIGPRRPIEAELGDTPHTLLPIASAALVDTQLSPEACIASLTNCLGEVSDTVYAAGPLAVVLGSGTALLSETPGERYLVFGVNHEATGLATYANVVVTHWSKRAGIASFESPDMPGSADAYLPDHPDRDALFVVEIARACEGRPHCLEIATDFPGVPPDESLAFLFRAYLAPGGTVAPDPAALVTARVIHVTP